MMVLRTSAVKLRSCYGCGSVLHPYPEIIEWPGLKRTSEII